MTAVAASRTWVVQVRNPSNEGQRFFVEHARCDSRADADATADAARADGYEVRLRSEQLKP